MTAGRIWNKGGCSFLLLLLIFPMPLWKVNKKNIFLFLIFHKDWFLLFLLVCRVYLRILIKFMLIFIVDFSFYRTFCPVFSCCCCCYCCFDACLPACCLLLPESYPTQTMMEEELSIVLLFFSFLTSSFLFERMKRKSQDFNIIKWLVNR